MCDSQLLILRSVILIDLVLSFFMVGVSDRHMRPAPLFGQRVQPC